MQSCYNPGGNLDPNYTSCNPSAGVSACCWTGESCIGENLCFSQQGYIYRGSCTDSSWKAPECPTVCRDVWNNNLIPCNVVDHGGWGTFACFCQAAQIQECCLQNFTLTAGFGLISAANINGVTAASSVSSGHLSGTSSSPSSQVPTTESSSSTSSQLQTIETSSSASFDVTTTPHLASDTTLAAPATSATATNSYRTPSPATPSNAHSKSTIIFAAIGVPLGILIMAVLIYFLLLGRKQRRRLEQEVAALSMSSSTTRYQISYPISTECPSSSDRCELPGDRGTELPTGKEITELQ
ncbi:MAG: hypothetical protein FRX48_00010 [Lasallia pustulata]|uniref:Uncharacterized protein n=1 Tax=Lasallia pustulata TaxID=136370 RepID=A0A5M8Q267_9LECA|nr:MAG: hypothetical protein FRX48_00010 [Lasallia pustulata]